MEKFQFFCEFNSKKIILFWRKICDVTLLTPARAIPHTSAIATTNVKTDNIFFFFFWFLERFLRKIGNNRTRLLKCWTNFDRFIPNRIDIYTSKIEKFAANWFLPAHSIKESKTTSNWLRNVGFFFLNSRRYNNLFEQNKQKMLVPSNFRFQSISTYIITAFTDRSSPIILWFIHHSTKQKQKTSK